MKKLHIFLLLFCSLSAGAQSWTATIPHAAIISGTPSSSGARLRFNLTNGRIYEWNPNTLTWVVLAQGIDIVGTGSAPAYTPSYQQSAFALSTISGGDSLYYYRAGSWHHLNPFGGGGGGGSTNLSWTEVSSTLYRLNSSTGNDVHIKEGTGVTAALSGDTLTFTATGGGGGTVVTDATLSGDGSGGTPLKIAQQSATSGQVLKWNGTTWLPAADGGTTYTGGTGIDVTGTVISNTGIITEVDGSTTNEIQQIDTFTIVSNVLRASLSSDGVPFKSVSLAPYLDNTDAQNLSLSGQALSISGGSGATLPIVNVVAGSGIGVSITSGAATVTNSAPDQTVSITGAGINNVTGTYPTFTVTGTEVDGSVSNEGSLTVGAGSGTTSTIVSNTSGSTAVTISASTGLSISEAGSTITLTNSAPDQTVSITGAGINNVTGTYPNFTVTGTEVDGSVSNELQTVTNTSNATTHTLTLSNTGGSIQLVEGSGITLSTSGTGADGVVTIAATAGGGGTVTATGGSLTSNAVVLGAGTTDTKVSTGITTDGGSALNLGVNATTIGKVKMFGNTSGDVTIQPTAAAGTATVQTLPATTGTLVNRVTTGNGVSASNSDGALSFTLGAITPTTVNGHTFTTGSSTFTGTAGQTYTFPTTTATIARTDAANTFTGVQTFSTPIAATSVATMTATVGGGVPTPPNNTTTFLRGDGTFAAPAAGSGDISNGGNTTGAAVTIGTNDANALNLETNNVTRATITGGASTGGALTLTDVTANTNTVENALTIRTNSSGTAAAGFGGGIVFQGESSTTDNQDMVRLSSIWTSATHGALESALVFSNVSGGALTERFRFTNSAMTTAGVFTIGNSSSQVNIGGSSGIVNINTSNTSTGAIQLNPSGNLATSTANINILSSFSLTQTSGTRNMFDFAYSFAPTSGTAVHNQLSFTGTINQTGGASGIVRGINFAHTMTAAADYRAIEIADNLANAHGIYQTGALTKNVFVGKTGFGATTAPTALVMLAAGTATANTAPLKFTSGTNLTSAEAGAMEYDGTELYFSPSTTRYAVDKVLRGSATLDFASTGAGAVADLTITVTGAADGDVVSLGVPNASITATATFTAWVSATNTVTVRFSPKATEDPASGTFKITVSK
jgi:hypothetical protein